MMFAQQIIPADGLLSSGTLIHPHGETASEKFLIAVIDRDNSIPELDETNNTVVFGPIPD